MGFLEDDIHIVMLREPRNSSLIYLTEKISEHVDAKPTIGTSSSCSQYAYNPQYQNQGQEGQGSGFNNYDNAQSEYNYNGNAYEVRGEDYVYNEADFHDSGAKDVGNAVSRNKNPEEKCNDTKEEQWENPEDFTGRYGCVSFWCLFLSVLI